MRNKKNVFLLFVWKVARTGMYVRSVRGSHVPGDFFHFPYITQAIIDALTSDDMNILYKFLYCSAGHRIDRASGLIEKYKL